MKNNTYDVGFSNWRFSKGLKSCVESLTSLSFAVDSPTGPPEKFASDDVLDDGKILWLLEY